MNRICWTSPLGYMYLAEENGALTHAGFAGQLHEPSGLERMDEACTPALKAGIAFLERYFAGEKSQTPPPLAPAGTPFQKEVWEILRGIPYGQSMSYGEIARIIAARHALVRMAAQAVGQAVGRNPISIFIPCHRVLGQGGALTGYAGGLERKRELLILEGLLPKKA